MTDVGRSADDSSSATMTRSAAVAAPVAAARSTEAGRESDVKLPPDAESPSSSESPPGVASPLLAEPPPDAGRRRNLWALLLPLPIAAVLLVLALRGVDWAAVLATLRRGRPELLLLAAAVFSVAALIRALRWRTLLAAERQIPLPTVFWATMVGYLGNNFLPARAGEVIRSVLIAREAKLATSWVLATALVERVVDVLALVVVSLLALVALGELPGWLPTAARGAGLLGLAALAALLLLPRLEPLLAAIVARLPLPVSWRDRLQGMLASFLLGMRALQNARRAATFVGLTAAIWPLDGLGALIVARAFDLPLTLPKALLLLAALGLASAVPSTPGSLGVYQFAAVSVLVPLGFTRDGALAQAIALQATTYAVVIAWGLLGLWHLTGGLRLPRRRPATEPPGAAASGER